MSHRFRVVYRIQGTGEVAEARAEGLALEQTVELPEDLVPAGFIREEIVGRVEDMRRVWDGLGPQLNPKTWDVTVSYHLDSAAGELTQLLNVVFGNSSLKAGIRVQHIETEDDIWPFLPGPRFGVAGLRERCGVAEKPLLCTALKPMGLPPEGIARLAYGFALGGIDIIKDDHGLSDQPFCPFEARLEACTAAVTRANRESGGNALYAPNVTAPADQLQRRARLAKEAGAGALLYAPGLGGFDGLRLLAEDASIDLPILSHPALLGGFVAHPASGIAHGALFGELQRMAGADASIFPNYGGRFGFSREECGEIADGCRRPLNGLKPILPSPGGGMTLERLPDMLDLHGEDVLLLIGGDLYRHSDDLAANARRFLAMLGR